MAWDGTERRMKPDFCTRHEQMMETIHKIDKTTGELAIRINGSIDDIEHHMTMSSAWRMTIVGIIVSIVIQVVTFSYLWGQASRQIAINTSRLDVLEQVEHEAQKIRYSNVAKIDELEREAGQTLK